MFLEVMSSKEGQIGGNGGFSDFIKNVKLSDDELPVFSKQKYERGKDLNRLWKREMGRRPV